MTVGTTSETQGERRTPPMYSIIYLIGLVVVVLAVLNFIA